MTSYESELGLNSIAGGRHPGWGTANRIVPLGDSYLELVAVVDEREAAQTDFGRWIALGASLTGRPLGWCVRPESLDATADRLGLRVEAGSRTKPTGERVAWRSAGVSEAVRRPGLPFFIEWENEASFPGAASAPAARIVRLEIECNAEGLDAWLGEHALPITVRRGSGGLTAVALDGPRGVVRLEPPTDD